MAHEDATMYLAWESYEQVSKISIKKCSILSLEWKFSNSIFELEIEEKR